MPAQVIHEFFFSFSLSFSSTSFLPVDVDVVLALLDEVASRQAGSTQAHSEEEPG